MLLVSRILVPSLLGEAVKLTSSKSIWTSSRLPSGLTRSSSIRKPIDNPTLPDFTDRQAWSATALAPRSSWPCDEQPFRGFLHPFGVNLADQIRSRRVGDSTRAAAVCRCLSSAGGFL